MKKPAPLIDQIPRDHWWLEKTPRPLISFIKEGGSAKRFLCGVETTNRVFELMFRHPDLYESQRQFALPPFDNTYVQFTFDDSGLVRHAGVLRIGDTATLMTDVAQPGPDTIRIGFHRLTFHDDGVRTSLWGSDQDLSSAERQDGSKQIAAYGGMTEVLWLIMHRPGLVQSLHIPSSQKVIKGKLRPFRAHSVLTIDLSLKDLAQTIQANNSRGPNREHQVRGTWVHLGISPGCTHDWHKVERPEGKPDRYECSCCKGLRVWRRDHVRGDASLGTKFHTYEVKV